MVWIAIVILIWAQKQTYIVVLSVYCYSVCQEVFPSGCHKSLCVIINADQGTLVSYHHTWNKLCFKARVCTEWRPPYTWSSTTGSTSSAIAVNPCKVCHIIIRVDTTIYCTWHVEGEDNHGHLTADHTTNGITPTQLVYGFWCFTRLITPLRMCQHVWLYSEYVSPVCSSQVDFLPGCDDPFGDYVWSAR